MLAVYGLLVLVIAVQMFAKYKNTVYTVEAIYYPTTFGGATVMLDNKMVRIESLQKQV